jgi:hypothetical protein
VIGGGVERLSDQLLAVLDGERAGFQRGTGRGGRYGSP